VITTVVLSTEQGVAQQPYITQMVATVVPAGGPTHHRQTPNNSHGVTAVSAVPTPLIN
jgi:hypothetical protein